MSLISLLLISTLTLAQSQNISDLEFFDRCFFLMTKSIPAANDPSLVKLKSKTITAPNACLEVLDRARLGSSNMISNTNDMVARSVLRTFTDFHSSWFQSRVNPSPVSTVSALIRDLEEPSLRITRALLGPNVQYKSILTGTTSYKGERVRSNKSAGNEFKSQVFFGYGTITIGYNTMDYLSISHTGTTGSAVADRLQAYKVPENRIIETGDLIGISPNAPLFIPTVAFPNPANARLPREIFSPLETNVDALKNFGGGLLGSQIFILNNANLGYGTKADQDILINRRIATRAFEDLMCHELPMLQAADVPAADIDPNSPQTFRRSANCMACHSQIDPFANTYRNLVSSPTSAAASVNNRIGSPTEIVRALPLVGTLNVWALTPPTGKLYYREYQSNAPTLRNVANIEQLGVGIGASFDFYRCAVKRYYRYFTGIDVALHALTPPTAGSSDYARAKAKYDLDKAHQQFVFNTANSLRSHQSLRTLISDILNTSTFRSRDFRSTRESP